MLYATPNLRGKLSGVKREERRALKQWLTAQLPEDMSRADVADELGVTRKTISAMLNPDQEGFGNGLTMLRYLQLAGAVADAPQPGPTTSRLARLEAQVAESILLTQEALRLLREARSRGHADLGEQPPRGAAASGTDG